MSEKTEANRRDSRLLMLDNRLDALCSHLDKVSSSIYSRVNKIHQFDPKTIDAGQSLAEGERRFAFTECIEEKIQRLEIVANQLDCINVHLENVVGE